MDADSELPPTMVSRKSAATFSVFTSLTIEMVEIDQSTKEYTSLEKLLRTMSPSSSILSPTAGNPGFHDIPLKDPIVRQAAWAYLQPTGAASENCDVSGGMKEVFRQVKDRFVAGAEKCGCLEWIHDVVFEGVLGFLFPKKRRIGCCTEEGEEEQEGENDGDGVSVCSGKKVN